MHKSREYYSDVDLPALASRIPIDRSARVQSEELGEMLWAVAYRCSTERITAEQLRSWLGEPDTVRQTADAVVWEYEWSGSHCGRLYLGVSPFVIKDGRVTGLESDGQSTAL